MALRGFVSHTSMLSLCKRRVLQGTAWESFNLLKFQWRFNRKLSYQPGDTAFRRTHAQELIVRMSPAERSMLLEELQNFERVYNPKTDDVRSNGKGLQHF